MNIEVGNIRKFFRQFSECMKVVLQHNGIFQRFNGKNARRKCKTCSYGAGNTAFREKVLYYRFSFVCNKILGEQAFQYKSHPLGYLANSNKKLTPAVSFCFKQFAPVRFRFLRKRSILADLIKKYICIQGLMLYCKISRVEKCIAAF